MLALLSRKRFLARPTIGVALGSVGGIGLGRRLGLHAGIAGAHFVLGGVGLQNTLTGGARGYLAARTRLRSASGRRRVDGLPSGDTGGGVIAIVVHSHG